MSSMGVVALWDNKLTLRKRHFLLFFVISRTSNTMKNTYRKLPDLLEAITKPTDRVKRRVTEKVEENESI